MFRVAMDVADVGGGTAFGGVVVDEVGPVGIQYDWPVASQ